MTLSAYFIIFMSKSVFDVQGCRALTLASIYEVNDATLASQVHLRSTRFYSMNKISIYSTHFA